MTTFAEARTAILDYLQARGWSLSSRSLKTPHATSPSGGVRLWFKAQAVYYSLGDRHDFGDARSLHVDIRTGTADHFHRWFMRYLDGE